MPSKPPNQRAGLASAARAASERERFRRRGSAASRGYGHRWRVAREDYLRQHPLCVMCAAEDHTRAATVVDHIQPHRGDQALFWDRANWQSLCKPHHDAEKQREDRADGATSPR